MQEIARFLTTHPPFDELPPETLEQTAATVEIAYFPRGASILRQSGEPSRYLHVIVKGVVELRQTDDRGASELVETLAEGETFGQLSLLSRSPHLWDVVAREDVLAYLVPSQQVERLRHHPGFEALLARRAGDRLRRALTARRELAPLDLFSGRAGDLVGRPLVTCDPGETVVEAARRMRDGQVSSLVVQGRPPGLVTASDLRDRVLAAGLSGETPVEAVMTAPLQTMPAEATLGEVLLAMVDRGIHHLPLVREGRLVGMVTDTDLLRHESRHPLFVRRQLDRATGPEGLPAYAREVAAAAVRLIGGGSPAGDVTRFVASAHDALYVRAARDGEAALGPARARTRCWSWAAAPGASRPWAPIRTMRWCWPTTRPRAPTSGSRPWPSTWRRRWSTAACPAARAMCWPPTQPGASRAAPGRTSSPAGSRSPKRTRCWRRPSSSTSANSTATWTPRKRYVR